MRPRACLRVGGEDATHFLQNLVTCEVEELAVGDLTFGALLTPQGKVLFDFFLAREGDGYLIDTLADARDALRTRLSFYKLRAAVTIEDDDRVPAIGASGMADPRSSALPHRSYGAAGIASGYDESRITAGVPEAGSDYEYGDVFPHDAGFDLYGHVGAGVAFTKGCYVGQEVVSRMKHRGTARRRPIVLNLSEAAETGAPVEADGREVGRLGTVVALRALAIVRLDRLEGAANVTVGSAPADWRPSSLLDR